MLPTTDPAVAAVELERYACELDVADGLAGNNSSVDFMITNVTVWSLGRRKNWMHWFVSTYLLPLTKEWAPTGVLKMTGSLWL